MAVGGVLVRDTTGVVTQTGPGTATFVLTSNGPGAVPTFQAAGGAGSAWSVLTNGDAINPDLVYDSDGDVIMTELLR
jgi:hypothetical protein